MAQFAPVDYGSPVQADTRGIESARQAAAQSDRQTTEGLQKLGAAGEETGLQATQATLHAQAAEATAKAAEGTEKAVNLIESNPYIITRETLMSSGADAATVDALWQKAQASGQIEHDKDGNEIGVPTHIIGRDLYAAMTKKAREEAAEKIGLPGWRRQFLKTAEVEALNKQEQKVDPKLAAHRTEYNRAKTLESIDRSADLATAPDDFRIPIATAETSPSLSPPEKLAKVQELRKRSDMVTALVAGRNPVDNMKTLLEEQTKLQSDKANEYYPNLNEHERDQLLVHVDTAIKMAKLQQDAAEKAQKTADKDFDDRLNAESIKEMATGRMNPATMFAKPGHPQGSLDQFWGQVKTGEGARELFHAITAFQANQEHVKDENPAARMAISWLYANDKDTFKAALISPDAVQTQFGSFKFSQDLSREAFSHWLDKYAGLADKEQSEQDRAKEANLNLRLGAVMMDPDGGNVNPNVWSNPQERVKLAAMQVFVEDAVKTARAKANRPLSTSEENKAMFEAAKQYRMNPPDTFFDHTGEGMAIKLSNGDKVTLSTPARDAMVQARRTVGGGGIPDFEAEGRAFFEVYQPIIRSQFKSVIGNDPDTEDEFNLFYNAMALQYAAQPVLDPTTQVRDTLKRMAAAAAARKLGGGK